MADKFKILTKTDSYTGKIVFDLSKEQFQQVLKVLDFNKTTMNSHIKKVVINQTQRVCTLTAYEGGTVFLNGCQNQSEMQSVIAENFTTERLNLCRQIIIKQCLTISNCRSLTKLNFSIDLVKLNLEIQKSSNSELDLSGQDRLLGRKVAIPEQIHQLKGVKIFVTSSGTIEIFKAQLLQNMENFICKFSKYLLLNFVKQNSQQRQPIDFDETIRTKKYSEKNIQISPQT